ncbi:putative F-box protein At3g16210 [Vicia villosa]|uniref:putative F-box protein At3g16210 n=1 Tax=Vicia villosa TaxID=3911 RepID=UPI00273B3001|nr:putative F-box protein At3g16210 [Vicia villosa]
MDPLLSASNFQVNSHIPDDIVFSILSKLSLKSLKRFQCVCKPWSLLFDNPYFMTFFRNYFVSKDHSFYDDLSFLLHLKNQGLLYSLSGEGSENNKVRFHWERLPLTDKSNDFSFTILGPICFNGTLFLQYYNNSGERNFMLWKPTTTEFRIIYTECSFPKVWSDHYQVGYDHVKDDYKMIRRTHCPPKSNLRVSSFLEVFSIKNKSWKEIDDDFPHSCRCSEEVYVDGVSHWYEKLGTRTHLVSFDFSKESFITTPVPSYTDEAFDFNSTRWMRTRILTVLNGSIAFIVHCEETSTFHILILGEIGVEESWTKLFSVGPLPCLKIPIGIGKKGNILIKKKNNELAWFDISTGTIDEIGVMAETYGKILMYQESFLPNGGIYSKLSSSFHKRPI